MFTKAPEPIFTVPQPRGFSFIEVLLVIGIVGMMILCLIGFFLSRNTEPLKIPAATAAPAAATPAPAAPAP